MPKKIDDPKPRTPRKVRFKLPTSLAIHNKNDVDGDEDDDGNGNGDDDDADDDDDSKNVAVKQKQLKKFDSHPAKLVSTSRRDERKVHGTANYVNGTLNFSTTDYPLMKTSRTNETPTIPRKPKPKDIETKPILFRNQFTNDASAKNVRKNCSIDQQYWDNAVNRRGILLHVSAENQQANNIKFRTNKFRRYTSVLMRPSKYFQRSRNRLVNCSKTSSPFSNTLELPKGNQLNKKHKTNLKSRQNPFEKFSYKLVSLKSATRKRTQIKPCESQPSEFDERALSIVCDAFNNQIELEQHCTSENLSEILQLAHRWQSSTQSIATSDNIATRTTSDSVESCTLKKLDVKK